jgi:hypothetical protein
VRHRVEARDVGIGRNMEQVRLTPGEAEQHAVEQREPRWVAVMRRAAP